MIRWASGWRPLDDPKLRLYFERELAWELEENPRHPLAGRELELVGGRGGYDDFLARLDGLDSYAWVHLTWNREREPGWPHTREIGDEAAVNRFLDDWDDPEPPPDPSS